MPITNPNPITPNVCGDLWVSSITISNPLFSAILRPYDGQYVLGNESLAKRVMADTSASAAAKAVVDAVFAQVARISGNAAAVTCVTASEADPLLPISVVAVFADGSTYRIADLFAATTADADLAAAYAGVIAWLGAQ
jgi:hypothetical protein